MEHDKVPENVPDEHDRQDSEPTVILPDEDENASSPADGHQDHEESAVPVIITEDESEGREHGPERAADDSGETADSPVESEYMPAGGAGHRGADDSGASPAPADSEDAEPRDDFEASAEADYAEESSAGEEQGEPVPVGGAPEHEEASGVANPSSAVETDSFADGPSYELEDQLLPGEEFALSPGGPRGLLDDLATIDIDPCAETEDDTVAVEARLMADNPGAAEDLGGPIPLSETAPSTGLDSLLGIDDADAIEGMDLEPEVIPSGITETLELAGLADPLDFAELIGSEPGESPDGDRLPWSDTDQIMEDAGLGAPPGSGSDVGGEGASGTTDSACFAEGGEPLFSTDDAGGLAYDDDMPFVEGFADLADGQTPPEADGGTFVEVTPLEELGAFEVLEGEDDTFAEIASLDGDDDTLAEVTPLEGLEALERLGGENERPGADVSFLHGEEPDRDEAGAPGSFEDDDGEQIWDAEIVGGEDSEQGSLCGGSFGVVEIAQFVDEDTGESVDESDSPGEVFESGTRQIADIGLLHQHPDFPGSEDVTAAFEGDTDDNGVEDITEEFGEYEEESGEYEEEPGEDDGEYEEDAEFGEEVGPPRRRRTWLWLSGTAAAAVIAAGIVTWPQWKSYVMDNGWRTLFSGSEVSSAAGQNTPTGGVPDTGRGDVTSDPVPHTASDPILVEAAGGTPEPDTMDPVALSSTPAGSSETTAQEYRDAWSSVTQLALNGMPEGVGKDQ